MFVRFHLLLFVMSLLITSAAADKSRACHEWSELGECEKNPDFMLVDCPDSCAQRKQVLDRQMAQLQHVHSFFDLEGIDIYGNVYPFYQLKNKVTVIVNVASFCGFTESAYKGLVELWSTVDHDQVHILAFPCDQFGNQEPGTSEEIAAFAKTKGVTFTMMQKIHVNGPDTSPIYLYLKSKADLPVIAWNFGTYFLISPDGSTVAEYTGVAPYQLKPFIYEMMLGTEEL